MKFSNIKSVKTYRGLSRSSNNGNAYRGQDKKGKRMMVVGAKHIENSIDATLKDRAATLDLLERALNQKYGR